MAVDLIDITEGSGDIQLVDGAGETNASCALLRRLRPATEQIFLDIPQATIVRLAAAVAAGSGCVDSRGDRVQGFGGPWQIAEMMPYVAAQATQSATLSLRRRNEV